MARSSFGVAFIAIVAIGLPARAATVTAQVSDRSGVPAANAVVALIPEGGLREPMRDLPSKAVIDQRHETFVPLVTIIRKGGDVVFANNDTTMHQVYSFSPIKQFEFEIEKGHRSDPVDFDKAGVASIGCNIHDHMIAYVYVSDTPWAVSTDERGHAEITDVPTGHYRVQVWHPQLPPGTAAAASDLNVNGDTRFAASIPLLSSAPSKHLHMGIY